MTGEQPAQSLTDAELAQIRDTYAKSQKVVSGIVGDPTGPYAKDCGENAIRHVGHLLAEVDRLRAENAAVKTKCDGFQKMMNSAVSAGVTIDGERLDALREVERLRAIVAAARKALFEDAASSHEHRYRAIARALEREECPDEYCAGWKDSGICPNDYRHRY